MPSPPTTPSPTVGQSERLRAFLFDYIILSSYLVAVTLITAGINYLTSGAVQGLFTSHLQSQALGFLSLTLPITIYFAYGDSSKRQGTWGRQKVGIQVEGLNGKRITFARAFLRTALKFIPWEIAHWCIWRAHFHEYDGSPVINLSIILLWGLVFANLARMALSRRNQSFYDLLTNTQVTRSEPGSRE